MPSKEKIPVRKETIGSIIKKLTSMVVKRTKAMRGGISLLILLS